MTRLAAFLLLVVPCVARAGMPSVTAVLNEAPKLRLQTISFFLAGFLLSAWFVQLFWNHLRKDFPSMPRLSYWRSVGLVALWGMLFVLVLTMISGARELMTPGAWEPDGITYKLAHKPGEPPPDEALEAARRERLERLKDALLGYARSHDGRFPPSQSDEAVGKDVWRVPGPSGMSYVYVGGKADLFDPLPLALEPEVFGGRRWVLYTNGSMRQLPADEARALTGGKR
jgi:hypothetical protein